MNADEIERENILLTRNSKIARITALVLTLCLLILWPWPMYGTAYVFSKPFFTAWVILGIVWMFISFVIVGIYPIVESHRSIVSVCKKVYVSITKRNQSSDDDTQMSNRTKMAFENPCNNNLELTL